MAPDGLHGDDCICGWCSGGWRRLASGELPGTNRGAPWLHDPGDIGRYLRPNARCPGCGASVFRVVSTLGGEVSLDELGPPWPVHACARAQANPAAPGWRRRGWHPLHVQQVTPVRDSLLVTGHLPGSKRAVRGFVPANTEVGPFDPALVLPEPAGIPGAWLLSWLPSRPDYDVHVERTTFMLGMAYALVSWENFAAAAAGNAEAQNAVGYDVSFAHRDEDEAVGRPTRVFPRFVPWDVALHWFDRAADGGDLIALNNLGVVAEHGYAAAHGVPLDPARAFGLYRRASRSRDPVPIRHLADCCERGFGTRPNARRARLLRAVADRLEAEALAEEANGTEALEHC